MLNPFNYCHSKAVCLTMNHEYFNTGQLVWGFFLHQSTDSFIFLYKETHSAGFDPASCAHNVGGRRRSAHQRRALGSSWDPLPQINSDRENCWTHTLPGQCELLYPYQINEHPLCYLLHCNSLKHLSFTHSSHKLTSVIFVILIDLLHEAEFGQM